MEWIDIAKAIGELGLFTVIAAVFLIQQRKDRKELNEQNEQFFKAQMEQNKQLLTRVLNGAERHLTEEEDSLVTEVDKTVDEYLQQLIVSTGATRAFVMRYHNGGRDMANIPFLRMSMTNEVVSLGKKPIMGDFQNQFRSMIAIICESLNTLGQSYISDVEEIKGSDLGTYEVLKGRGIASIYCRPIHSINNYVIGFVGLSYATDNKNKRNVETISYYLEDTAQGISALMQLKK